MNIDFGFSFLSKKLQVTRRTMNIISDRLQRMLGCWPFWLVLLRIVPFKSLLNQGSQPISLDIQISNETFKLIKKGLFYRVY